VGRKRAERQTVIEGAPQACFDAIVDYETFPDWQRSVKDVDIRSRDRQGRGKEVAFEIDAKVKTVRYTLDYSYEEPHLVSWRYVEGEPKDVDGQLVLEDNGDGTTLATYSLDIDPGIWLPGKVVSLLNEQVMHGALEDLKRRVEA
jgi:Polyketide cyclase / dehydrase and lipid transport